jgi:Caspase domain
MRCRGDPGGRSETPNVLTKAYTEGFNFEIRNRGVKAFIMLYATEEGQRAWESAEKKRGYFSWALEEALSGKAANVRGEVTLSALVSYLQERVPKQVQMDMGS